MCIRDRPKRPSEGAAAKRRRRGPGGPVNSESVEKRFRQNNHSLALRPRRLRRANRDAQRGRDACG
eukprot:1244039-Pyramimonas_sp.AAC.1